MRRLRLLAVALALCLTLDGCAVTGEVENQAYVLVLALDRLEDGTLGLTARVPRIGRSGGSDKGEKSGGSPYLVFSASGTDWAQALDALQQVTPRQINLCHIEMIVAARDLASEPDFPRLMRRLSDTPHLYTNARFVVCRGRARDILAAGRTVIGMRLSSEIRAMLKQYSAQGIIPEACLADFCCCSDAIYGDPVAIWGDVELPDGGDAQTPMAQRFSGAALFREGVFFRALSRQDTRLLRLLQGNAQAFTMVWDGAAVELAPDGRARKAVVIEGDSVRLEVSVKLHATNGIAPEVASAIAESLRQQIKRLIDSCLSQRCDPFGFAETAAARFGTVQAWLAWNWRDRFAGAEVSAEVSVS